MLNYKFTLAFTQNMIVRSYLYMCVFIFADFKSFVKMIDGVLTFNHD